MKKVCKTCGKEKHLDDFVINYARKDNRTSVCKDCHNEYNRKRRLKVND